MSVKSTIQPSVLFPDGTIIYLKNITSLQAVAGVVNVGVGGAINAFSYTTPTAPANADAQHIVDEINNLINTNALGQTVLATLLPLVPEMSDYTVPSGTVSTSSDGTSPAWHAFNSSDGLSWIATNSSLPQWLQYEFPAGHVMGKYSLYCDTGGVLPTDWKLEGSNDGVTWTLLDNQTAYSWPIGQLTTIFFNNTASFTTYRLTITGMNVPQPAYISVMQLYGA